LNPPVLRRGVGFSSRAGQARRRAQAGRSHRLKQILFGLLDLVDTRASISAMRWLALLRSIFRRAFSISRQVICM
jgi:hypothetical protein